MNKPNLRYCWYQFRIKYNTIRLKEGSQKKVTDIFKEFFESIKGTVKGLKGYAILENIENGVAKSIINPIIHNPIRISDMVTNAEIWLVELDTCI